MSVNKLYEQMEGVLKNTPSLHSPCSNHDTFGDNNEKFEEEAEFEIGDDVIFIGIQNNRDMDDIAGKCPLIIDNYYIIKDSSNIFGISEYKLTGDGLTWWVRSNEIEHAF